MTTQYIPLRCLGQAGAPAEMLRDLRHLAALPAAARAHVWTVLGPALNEQLPHDMNARVNAFAAQHNLSGDQLAAMVRAYRLLLRSSYVVGATPADLANDLDDAAQDEAQGERMREAILPAFPSARSLLQQEATGGAVNDHGKLLVGVDWRLDRIVASTRGDADGAFVGMLTLHCREQGTTHRLTVQALPDAIEQLSSACQQLITAAKRTSG